MIRLPGKKGIEHPTIFILFVPVFVCVGSFSFFTRVEEVDAGRLGVGGYNI